MRLERFSVQKYRSIIRMEKLDLGDLTVLVGPNNEGKSNILQALVAGMEELSAERSRPQRAYRGRGGRYVAGYVWERDFPYSLQDAGGASTMDFDFRLSPDEVNEFQSEVGSRLNGDLPLRLSFAENKSTFLVRKQRHSEALSARRVAIARFMASRVRVQYVPPVRNADVTANIVRSLIRRELRAAESDPKYAKALERLRSFQQPVLERISDAISNQMQRLLPDVQSVELRIDERALPLGEVQVIVDDGTPTELEYKGDGVQSLAALGLLQHYSDQDAPTRDLILAVEEPEAHLHPDAIHALRSVLHETAADQQVVLATHSPIFVNRLDVRSNVIVQRTQARSASNVQELREALGVRPADNLLSAEVVLVVEGDEDAMAMRALLADRSDQLRSALADGVLKIQPLHGGAKLSYALRQLEEALVAVHAFLDADMAGKAAADAARAAGLLSAADQTFADCVGAKEAEFEDLVDAAIYKEAAKAQFNVDLDHRWIDRLSKGKWSARMALIFQDLGQAWNPAVETALKRIVAEAVAVDPQRALKASADPLIKALETALEQKLERRRP